MLLLTQGVVTNVLWKLIEQVTWLRALHNSLYSVSKSHRYESYIVLSQCNAEEHNISLQCLDKLHFSFTVFITDEQDSVYQHGFHVTYLQL